MKKTGVHYLKIRENSRKTKRKSIYLIILCILIMLFLMGSSYAILQLTLKGKKNVELIAGVLNIEYKDKNLINLENIYPMNDTHGMMLDSYEFSIENTGDIKAFYEVSLEEKEKGKDSLDIKYLKYSLQKEDGKWSDPAFLSSLPNLVLLKGEEVEVKKKNVYRLKIWVDENTGNEAQGKTFSARVVVNATQEKGKTDDITPPVIKLKGSLSENVEQNSVYQDTEVESVTDDRDTLDKSNVGKTYEYYNGESTVTENAVDTEKLGVHYVYYKISDTSGNEGVTVKSVNVYKKDTTPPEIKLNGEDHVTIEVNESYEEKGASAEDDVEGDISDRVVIVGEVNTKKAGTYPIKYLITDQEGNTASIVRVVNVIQVNVENSDIVLDLNGKNEEKINITGANLGTLQYKSNQEGIVEVSEEGVVRGLKVGETEITVESDTGVSKVIRVRVQKTVTITYQKESGVSTIGKESDSCVITTDGGSCQIELPTITSLPGYNEGFWTTDKEETRGTAPGGQINLSENSNTYYAKALDTTKPEWSLVSTSPANGTVAPTGTVTITFKGTDTSASVIPSIAVENITVKLGTTTVNPTTKNLSFATDVANGKQYVLTLTGFGDYEGVLSLEIAASTLKDDSNNVNNKATFTTSITVEDPDVLYNRLKNLSNNSLSENGVHQLASTKDDLHPVYYYHGTVDNNLIFGGFCWKVVRTTSTGGVKLLYNGRPADDGSCKNTGSDTEIGKSTFNSGYNFLAYVGYMYNPVYISQIKKITSEETEWVFGNDVDYQNGSYTLKKTVKINPVNWSSERANMSTGYHYTCFSSDTNCSDVSYAYYQSSSEIHYITLTGGKKVEDALEEVFENKTDSIIKTAVESWYTQNMTENTKYLEDTVWCNDRTIYQIAGWDKDGDASNYLFFGSHGRSAKMDCERREDSFSVSEDIGNGLLDNPIGLLTVDEARLAGSGYLGNGNGWWLGSPSFFYFNSVSCEYDVGPNGSNGSNGVGDIYGVRPAVSLKPGTKIASGEGTDIDPYIVS